MKNKTLKRCPFCGSKAEILEGRGWCACSNNGCPAWQLKALFEVWNTRATDNIEQPLPTVVAEAARGKFLIDYLTSPREDLDDTIVAACTQDEPDQLRTAIDSMIATEDASDKAKST